MFAAGYLKGCEELVAMKKDKSQAARYEAILKLTQDIYGKNDIPDQAAADGLVSDAAFVGLPGNKSFFTQKGNLSGFDAKLKAALRIAAELNGAQGDQEFPPADLDYDKLAKIGDLTGKASPSDRFRDDVKFLTEDTIFYFTINFDPGQTTFPAQKYGAAFQRALEQASLFGNAVMVLRGHTDAFGVIKAFREQGLASGQLKQGDGPNKYTLNGIEFDIRDVPKLIELLKKADFADNNLKTAPQRLLELSQKRADAVRDALLKYAEEEGYQLDRSQVRSVGVGFAEPVAPITDPNSKEEAAKHRRVEFRLIKVAPSSIKGSDFDY
jgi:outer membrane protein OmpA-like peptidoglycan-associated protein